LRIGAKAFPTLSIPEIKMADRTRLQRLFLRQFLVSSTISTVRT
jgi:hypothetical protein